MNLISKTVPRATLHPASCKHLLLGHPWITEDSYTRRFPKNEFFLIGVDERKRQEIALLINDPEHKNVKARLWSLAPNDWKDKIDFFAQLEARISTALEKRANANYKSERENYYLINGENDFLPGLLVIKLKDQLLIQYYALFWKKIEKQLLDLIKKKIQELLPAETINDIWIQERNFSQEKFLRSEKGKEEAEFVLSEYGINYKIKINERYDFGIYTDMSAVRSLMSPYLKKAGSLLNLYSYTGAFSLYGLKSGIKEVVSVDLSSKYLEWLEENLALNPDLNKAGHTSLCMPSERALTKLLQEKKSFDCIICDPPSASSDGKETSSALKSYEKLLPLMLGLLNKNGSLFVFLNTHTVSWAKFEEKLKAIITSSEYNNQVTLGKRFRLSDDCQGLKGFQEGDYLKGLLIEFKNKEK